MSFEKLAGWVGGEWLERREAEAGKLAVVGGRADVARGSVTRLKGGLEAKETMRIGAGRATNCGRRAGESRRCGKGRRCRFRERSAAADEEEEEG